MFSTVLLPLSMHVFLMTTMPDESSSYQSREISQTQNPVLGESQPVSTSVDQSANPTRLANPSVPSDCVPRHLFMPPNPPAPGRDKALSLRLPYLLSERTTNYRHASPSQAKNIELVARRLNGVIVRPGDTFSYFSHVGPYTADNGFGWGRAFVGDRIVPSMGGGVCQGASTLYSALLRTGLPIVERHNHGLTVPYLPAGEDATVSSSANLDFRFRNDQSSPILITASTEPGKRYLTVSIWGAQKRPNIEVKHRVLATYPFHVIHRHSDTAVTKTGTKHTKQNVLFPGQEGAKVNTWVSVHAGNRTITKEISIDVYQSSPRIVD